MSTSTQASEIAREVLRQLAMRRQLPTPDNYTALYNEIAGSAAAIEIFPEKPLARLAAALPRKSNEELRLARRFETAIEEQSWAEINTIILDLVEEACAEHLAWPQLIRDLLTQLERSHSQLTPGRKRESLEHLLKSTTAAELFYTRLQSLLRSWSQGADATEMLLADIPAAPAPLRSSTAMAAATAVLPTTTETPTSANNQGRSPTSASTSTPTFNHDLQEWIALLLDNTVATLLIDAPELAAESASLAAEIRTLRTPEAIAGINARLRKFAYRLQFVAEDQVELRSALHHLLRLIIENIGEVVLDNRPLHGQVTALLDILGKPLNLRQLDDVERRMKDVIFKQGMLKKQLTEAQDRLKSMLANFVDRLADMSDETDTYHGTIETCAERITAAADISQISEVLEEVMTATRAMQLNSERSRDELHAMRGRLQETELEIERLQGELAQASDMVRIDPLTGMLNRKGMEEALDRELSRFQRHQSSLCLVLLDLDNFKKLNDTLGHQAGDEALIHLANVVREALRPQDTLARYGGEEFVVILPETPLDESVTVVTRLQRELTRKFFMRNNEKHLITFSAGVAELGRDETPQQALERADQAMYLAKRSGKNRVMTA